jgi:hypothetical protein
VGPVAEFAAVEFVIAAIVALVSALGKKMSMNSEMLLEAARS